MRRAKILVKPNIGAKVSSGPPDKVLSAPVEVTSTLTTGTQSSTNCAINQLVKKSSEELCLDECVSPEVGSLAKCSVTDLDLGAKGHTSDKLDLDIACDPSPTFQQVVEDVATHVGKPSLDISGSPTVACKTSHVIQGVSLADVSQSDQSTKKESVIEELACVVDETMPLAKVPARRLKTHWKPNLMKVSAAVKPSVSELIVKLPETHPTDENEGLGAVSSTPTTPAHVNVNNIPKTAEEIACSSSIDSSTVHHRTVDVLTSPTSVIRRGKFAAKPNVAKAARVRQMSVGESSGSFFSTSAFVQSGSGSTLVPARSSTGEMISKDESTASSGLVDHSQSMSACLKTVDEESGSGAPTASSTALNLSPEKVAAKMIERKLKQRKKRRLLEQLVGPVDRKTVCIRDLIYMNPVNNPMAPPMHAASGSQSTQSAQSPSVSKIASTSQSESASAIASDDNDENYAPVPQVKVGPDGKIILNFDSVVLEEKKSQVEEKLEVVDESNLIRHGYPKKNRCRLWDTKETRKFYLLLSQIGTDFSLMCRRFPDRSRTDLKKKFKREEKIHHELIERALGERRGLDITLLAEPCSASSEDELIVAPKSKRPARKRKPDVTVTKDLQVEPVSDLSAGQTISDVKKGRGGAGKPKKKKMKKPRYYECSSDSNEDDVAHVQSPPSTAIGPSSSTVSSTPVRDAEPAASKEQNSTHSVESEDEVEIIKHICGRPTKSGRIPRPSVIRQEVEDELQEALSVASSPQIRKSSPSKRTDSIVGLTQFPVKGNSVLGWSSSSTAVSTLPDVQRTPGPRSSHSSVGLATPRYLTSPATVSPGTLGVSRLPSGVYVVLESPQSSASVDGSNTDANRQVLYHIFAEMSSPAQAASPGLSSTISNGSMSGPSHSVQSVRPFSPQSLGQSQSVGSPGKIRPLDAAGQVFRPLHTVGQPLRFGQAFGQPYATRQPVSLPQHCYNPSTIPGHFDPSGLVGMRVRNPLESDNHYLQYPNLYTFPGATASALRGFINTAPAPYPNATAICGPSVRGSPNTTAHLSFVRNQFVAQPLVHHQAIQSPTGSMFALGSSQTSSGSPTNISHTLITTRQQDGTVVIFAEPSNGKKEDPDPIKNPEPDVVKREDGESSGSTRTIRVIEHQDGSTELLIDGDPCPNAGNQRGADGAVADGEVDDDSQYIDVVVEHYPISDSS